MGRMSELAAMIDEAREAERMLDEAKEAERMLKEKWSRPVSTTNRPGRGIDISPRNAGVFQCVNRDQLRVGDRVRVYIGAMSSIGGQCGTVVGIPEPGLYRVRSDGGLYRHLARRDLAME